MTVKLLIFDMDGVIFNQRNFWLDLHRVYATEDAAMELAARYLKTDYHRLGQLTVQLWKGQSAEPFLHLVRTRCYEDGVVELFGELHRRGLRTAIVSSGPYQLAERAQHDLGVDEIRANCVEVVEGRISGRVRIDVPDGDKDRVALDVMRALGAAPDETAAIGDSESDASMVSAVGLAIAYESNSERLNSVAHVHLSRGSLPTILEVLDRDWRG